jgi:hypothetical protein
MTDTPTITIATLETRNFTFQAVGTDDAHALRILEVAWSKHAAQYSQIGVAPWDEISGLFYGNGPENVRFTTLPVGGATRDGERIV